MSRWYSLRESLVAYTVIWSGAHLGQARPPIVVSDQRLAGHSPFRCSSTSISPNTSTT
ncbi:hypothetical protein PF005_g14544 [Phytophthora fragariae]|uniref:Uncharacterized protein n=2 Tax=Phytophthora TaxID=4783 RepID=A0A6A3TJH1_9STRA|nr:hypothetical protein PF003_g10311 [Phytophthora fragariae]KAE9018978.1 hypothetical protein PR002_g12949 [Phytophthora rubi]KAE8935399.1 hypothetical protein PF009_g14660 [Phytophthora fragariae]KAE9001250.1 hypothetical protein PF011_g13827 [Phytophthora fragariae]KAE9101379.1 hypothetical protein PF007_g15164 [Phytophthora fragariae]